MTSVAIEPLSPTKRTPRPTWLGQGLLAALVLPAVVVLWAGRGTSFLGDEWAWVFAGIHPSAATYLDPYNGHLIASTYAFFTVMTRLAGLGSYLPYRLAALTLHLVIALEIFVLARRRLPGAYALVPVALIATLGTGADAFLTAINLDELTATACGLGALALLDHDRRLADLGACGLLALALLSWTSAVALAAGALVELLAGGRSGWRRIWLVLIPVALYAAWRIHWAGGLFADVGVSGTAVPGPVAILDHAAQSAAAAVFGIVGVQLTSPTLRAHLPWLPRAAEAVVIGGAAAAGLAIALRRRTALLTPRLLGLLTNGLVLWLLLGAARGSLGDSYASRYVYVGAIVVLLVAVELAAASVVPPRAGRAIVAVAAVSVALNLVWMIVWGNHLRDETTQARAGLAALQISGPRTPASFAPSPEFGLAAVRAGNYFAALKRFGGSPADSAAALARAPESAREAADQILVRASRGWLTTGASRVSAAGPAFGLESASNVTVRHAGACVAATAARGNAWLGLRLLPGSTVLISVGHSGALLILARRFADRYTAGVGGVGPGRIASLVVPPGGASPPWQLKAFVRQEVGFCPGGRRAENQR